MSSYPKKTENDENKEISSAKTNESILNSLKSDSNSNSTTQSRIKLLQQKLLVNKMNLHQPNERAQRDKELKELLQYRLVSFDDDDDHDDANNGTNKEISPLISNADMYTESNSDHASSNLPSVMSEGTESNSTKQMYNGDDTIISSEWRDETILNSSSHTNQFNIEPALYSPSKDLLETDKINIKDDYSIDLCDISQEKIQSLDKTLDSLEELELIHGHKNTKHIRPTVVSEMRVNSEPGSPSKLDISKRDYTYAYNKLLHSSVNQEADNISLKDQSTSSISTCGKKCTNLVKTSTRLLYDPSKYFLNDTDITNYQKKVTSKISFSPQYNDNIIKNSSPNNINSRKNSSPIFPKFESDAKISSTMKASPSIFHKDKDSLVCENDGIQKDIHLSRYMTNPESINYESDSYHSLMDTSRIEDCKQYHVKRRSLSASRPFNIQTIGILSNKQDNLSITTNHSIGFNPTLSSYDHPDDVSRNLSFSNFESECALHNYRARDILIKKYYSAAKVQQQIISQSENILNLIYAQESNFYASARLPCCLDAESLLLLSTYRRNLFLHKASKLKRGNVYCKCGRESRSVATASVSVSDIYIQISDKFTNSLKYTQPDSYYYFLAIITFGDSDVVFCTKPTSIYDINSKNLLLLPGKFSNGEIFCDESVNVEIYARKLYNKKDGSKFNEILKTRFRKRPINKNASGDIGVTKNRECAFSFVGSCAIPVTEKNSEILTLYNKNSDIPIGPRLSVSLSFHPNYESYAQGFLSLYKMEGGLPCWQRYWCVLQKSSLKMWNWKDDDPNNCVMCVDLKWDVDSCCKVLPLHICARSNTMEITLTTDPNTNLSDTNKFISKPAINSFSAKIYSIWLSADNAYECNIWLNALTLHLDRYKDWKRAISTQRSTVPSRRLV